MGFCRRCGDIVVGPRCKCGGSAVAPSVQFDRDLNPDRWSSTYVTRDTSPTRSLQKPSVNTLQEPRESQPVRRFPRPLSTTSQTNTNTRTRLGDGVSSHIHSSAIHRSSSPLKTISHPDDLSDSTPTDILPDPKTSTLAKAYGSVLQPKETLTTFTCIHCSTPFAPDATIYPDPTTPNISDRFLCKLCFTQRGGSKGDCTYCGRPVLMLASEGGFVENSGNVWHKRCFRCNGCFKDVSDTLLVDLLGRPSCEDCFDSCLKRPSKEYPRYKSQTPEKAGISNSPARMKVASREASPVLQGLHQRLGIRSPYNSPRTGDSTSRQGNSSPVNQDMRQRTGISSPFSSPIARNSPSPSFGGNRSREGSPVVEELTARLVKMKGGVQSPNGRDKSERGSVRDLFNVGPESPLSRRSPKIDDSTLKQRAAGNDSRTTTPTRRIIRRSVSSSFVSPSSVAQSESSASSTSPSTPDLMSDYSDTATQSSSPSTPQSDNAMPHHTFSPKNTPTTPTRTPTSHHSKRIASVALPGSPQAPCAKCSRPLFRNLGGARYLTIPEDPSTRQPPKSYHVECFRCVVCDGIFEAEHKGQAVFVRCSSGYCHVGCATPERIVVKRISTPSSSSPTGARGRPLSMTPPASLSFPRFGGALTCPGCSKSVSPMERGVVPGPQGSRWHASCLVCGGKGADSGNREKGNPGCGKRLDSAAKSDGEGGVWCRECLLLLSKQSDREGSPIRALSPTNSGSTGVYSRFPVITGRSSGTVTPQLPGRGLSPTRQLSIRSSSPVKQFMSGRGGGIFPRPKSVIGGRMPNLDEGRGMTLVRQMAGGRVV